MSTRARLAVAAAIALVSAIGIGVVIAHWIGGPDNARAPVGLGLHETPADTPFRDYREVKVAFADRCVRVAVADTPERRERGLRSVIDLGPYAGMLFSQARDTNTAFTMAGVTVPLDITWYGSDGSRVDATQMPPCPQGGAASCPVYRSRRPYRVALETPDGSAPPERLAPCP